MTSTDIQAIRQQIWEALSELEHLPKYPAIVRRVLITNKEEEYLDHDPRYDEKYQEELTLREGFLIAVLGETDQLEGIGDCLILDFGKRSLLRAPLIRRCGVVLPLIPYQGWVLQPEDYRTYGERILELIERYRESANPDTLFHC